MSAASYKMTEMISSTSAHLVDRSEDVVGNVVPQHYSPTLDCLIKSHSKKVTPITVPKAALVSSEAKNLY